eukprot:5179301-Prymnesium_polylepis.1
MALSAALLLLLAAQPAMLLQPCASLRLALQPAHAAASRPLVVASRARLLAMEAEAEKAEAEAEAEAAEPASEAAAAEPPAKTEKEELKEKIAALEATLKTARGDLIYQQEQVKDAGEAGYMLLAADFERYRLQAKSELELQGGVGRRATIRDLLTFVEEFERLQGSSAETEQAADIHKYYGGIDKQLTQLLESWELSSFEATVGERCDPLLHSKVKIVESPEAEGTILEVLSKGWTLGGDTVRGAECV